MLTISVELIHGILRANSSDDTALTGAGSTPEWPPSPARLFSALVAAAGTGDRPPEHVGVLGLDRLEGVVPDIYASAPSQTLVSSINDRYVVIDQRSDGTVQNYPARKAQRYSPGARVSPLDARVQFVWPDLTLSADELTALRYRAARVPYIGCADSPARLSVSDEAPVGDLPCWSPDPTGSVTMPVPPEGYLAELDEMFDAWSAGQRTRRSWLRTPHCRYRTPDDIPDIDEVDAPVTLWVRFDRAVDQRRCVLVAETLRNAVLSRIDAAVGGRDNMPEVLHGHLKERRPGMHVARWIPLPTVGVPHADGRLRGACVWLPADVDTLTVDLVRDALAGITELRAAGLPPVGMHVFDGTTRPWSSNPQRWVGPATRWVTATPVVHERYTHAALTLATVTEWCANAGIPAPIAIRESAAPLLAGSKTIHRSEISRNGRLRGPTSYLELEFERPVTGPLVLGRGRGFGLGLLAPNHPRDSE